MAPSQPARQGFKHLTTKQSRARLRPEVPSRRGQTGAAHPIGNEVYVVTLLTIVRPGTWLALPDPAGLRVVSLVDRVCDRLAMLAMSYDDYLVSREWAPEVDRDAIRRRPRSATAASEHADPLSTERRVMQERAAAGHRPTGQLRLRTTQAAEHVVLHLGQISRTLDAVATELEGTQFADAASPSRAIIAARLPGLKGVRDSIEHGEDRTRAIARGQAIDLQPVSIDGFLMSTSGGFLLESVLIDGALHSTDARGAVASVAISETTLQVMVTAGAALDLGIVDPRAKFRCVDPIQIDGLTVDCRNHAQLPVVDFREAFAWSCNRTFALTGLELGLPGLSLADGLKPPFPWKDALGTSSQRLEQYAQRFWIGRSVPFELPVEAGQVKGSTEWYPSLLAQTAFGQGELAVTPMQMALVAATVANGGSVPAPYVAVEARSPGGASTTLGSPGGTLGRAISAAADSTLNEMMVLSVDTAYAHPAAIAGVKVGGKTGTAEAGETGTTPHSWFVGYAPADNPRVAIAVIMERKGSGTDFATPAAKVVLQRALEVYQR